MAISVDKANIVFKDKQGNVGKVQSLSDSDIAKISANITNTNELTTALSDEISARANADTILQASSISLGNRVTSIEDDYVTTDTKQTIDGEKTFTNQWLYFKNNNADIDNYSEYDADKDQKIWFTDKDGERYAYMGAIHDKNGNHIIEIGNYKQSTNVYSVGFKAFYNSETGQAWAEGVNLLPTGSIIAWAVANKIPSGFLYCNGAAVSRSTYKHLFDTIGTTWGSGDGSTTFNIPDARDRWIQGSSPGAVGAYSASGLPNTGGSLWNIYNAISVGVNGVFFLNWENFAGSAFADNNNSLKMNQSSVQFRAGNDNSIYGASNKVQPPSITVDFIIKT